MAIGLVFGEEVVKTIRAYAPQNRKLDAENDLNGAVFQARLGASA